MEPLAPITPTQLIGALPSVGYEMNLIVLLRATDPLIVPVPLRGGETCKFPLILPCASSCIEVSVMAAL